MEGTEELLDRLRRSGHTLALAESCTGGWMGREITRVPGASDVFWGGVMAYSNDAKRSLLDVDRELLHEEGAVSEAAARAMARGAASRSGATWGVAVTGIAGPGGGTPEKPVGTVWIAVSGPVGAAERYRFEGDREEVRERSVRAALDLLEQALDRHIACTSTEADVAPSQENSATESER